MNQQLNTLPSHGTVMPILVASDLTRRKRAVNEVVKDCFVKDTHYGTVPGAKKDSLLKAGAEALCSIFGLVPECSHTVTADDQYRTWDWEQERKNRDGSWYKETGTATGYYEVQAQCRIYSSTGGLLAQASANCNSWELKYRRTPVFDTRNTIVKMAEKRAFVAAVLMATGCSDMFTQDLEDGVVPPAPASYAPRRESAPPEQQVVSVLSQPQIRKVFATAKDMGLPEEVASNAVKALTKAEARSFMDKVFAGDRSAFAPYQQPAEA